MKFIKTYFLCGNSVNTGYSGNNGNAVIMVIVVIVELLHQRPVPYIFGL